MLRDGPALSSGLSCIVVDICFLFLSAFQSSRFGVIVTRRDEKQAARSRGLTSRRRECEERGECDESLLRVEREAFRSKNDFEEKKSGEMKSSITKKRALLYSFLSLFALSLSLFRPCFSESIRHPPTHDGEH